LDFWLDYHKNKAKYFESSVFKPQQIAAIFGSDSRNSGWL